MEGEEGGDGEEVLREPGDEVKELDVPGNREGSGGRFNLGLAGGIGCGEEGSLKFAEDLPGVDVWPWVQRAAKAEANPGDSAIH